MGGVFPFYHFSVAFREVICPLITKKQMFFFCVIPGTGKAREGYFGLILVHTRLLQPSAYEVIMLPCREEGGLGSQVLGLLERLDA